MEKIYFGHPVDSYNTVLERELLRNISHAFKLFEIVNPNSPVHQQGYRDFKERFGNGMKYYFEMVLPEISVGVFLPFVDGMLGAGVFGEAEFLHQREKQIFEINNAGVICPMGLDLSRKLSIEETFARINFPRKLQTSPKTILKIL